MKIVESLLFFCWLLIIFVSQFHGLTKKKLRDIDFLSLVPSFHLFSPKPFTGRYVIRYKVFDLFDPKIIVASGDIDYFEEKDFLDCNKKIIKCINNLCKGSSPRILSNNYLLLVHYVKSEVKKNIAEGKMQFSVLVKYNETEKLKFKSKINDL